MPVHMDCSFQFPPLLPPNLGPMKFACNFTRVLEHALDRLDSNDPGVEAHIVHKTDEFVTLHDGYPKATVHLLVLPRTRIGSVKDLRMEHLPMLQRLARYIASLIDWLGVVRCDLSWIHGIHSVPSLQQLHVHVISHDFRSPCLKNAKHFNSFQRPFLLAMDDVLTGLQEGHELSLHFRLHKAEEDMKQKVLQCHRCHTPFGRKFAELKKHLAVCNVPIPGSRPTKFISTALNGPKSCATGEIQPSVTDGQQTLEGLETRQEVPEAKRSSDSVNAKPSDCQKRARASNVVDLT